MARVNTKPLFEVINEAAEAEGLYDKVEFLRTHNSPSLRKLLRYAIDPEIIFNEYGDPQYRPNMDDGCETLLYNRIRLIYLFRNDPNRPVKQDIANRVLVEVLEEIDHRDAELLLLVIKKKLPKGLTKQIVLQAFPGILDEQLVS